MWFTFVDDRARSVYRDWNDIADEQVANLHAEVRGADDDTRMFAERLARAAGSEFTERWDRRPCSARTSLESSSVLWDSPDRAAECVPDRVAERVPDRVAERVPDRVAERVPDRVAERVEES